MFKKINIRDVSQHELIYCIVLITTLVTSKEGTFFTIVSRFISEDYPRRP